MSKKKKKRVRRRYRSEFKTEAIRLVQAEGVSISEVARNIGVEKTDDIVNKQT